MAKQGFTAKDAFDVLFHRSQEQNRKCGISPPKSFKAWRPATAAMPEQKQMLRQTSNHRCGKRAFRAAPSLRLRTGTGHRWQDITASAHVKSTTVGKGEPHERPQGENARNCGGAWRHRTPYPATWAPGSSAPTPKQESSTRYPTDPSR